MEVTDRIKKVVKWLIGEGYANNQKEVGRLLGYANESAFSQVLNGHVDLPADFIPRICSLDDRLNVVWLQSGEGEMLTGSPEKQRAAEAVDAISIPADAWQLIRQQVADNQKRTEQMDRLIALVEQWSGRYDRVLDRLDHLSEAVSVSFRPFESIRTDSDGKNPPPRKIDPNKLIISKKGQIYVTVPAKKNTIKS